VLPIIDVVLFEMRKAITCVNNFSPYLRDKGTSATCRVISPEMLTYHALLDPESLQEYVGGGRMARIEMGLLNQLMGTTRRAQNIGCLGDGIETLIAFSIRYSPYAQLTDRAGGFPRVLSRKFSKGS
jgi:hypothetical protein